MSAFDPTDSRSLARRADVYALAFEEAGRALAEQERTLQELRGRGAGLVATAAVTTSLFGGPAAGQAHVGVALYVGVAAFVGVCLCTLVLLWPFRLAFSNDPSSAILMYAEPHSYPLAFAHRDLTLHRTSSFRHNWRVLHRLTWLSRFTLVLLAIEVVAWVVNYAMGV